VLAVAADSERVVLDDRRQRDPQRDR
jgi:hypothetical protein